MKTNEKNKNVVYGGYDKWSIGVNDDGQIVITADHGPISVDVLLGDTCAEDFRKLAHMFARHADIRLGSELVGVKEHQEKY